LTLSDAEHTAPTLKRLRFADEHVRIIPAWLSSADSLCNKGRTPVTNEHIPQHRTAGPSPVPTQAKPKRPHRKEKKAPCWHSACPATGLPGANGATFGWLARLPPAQISCAAISVDAPTWCGGCGLEDGPPENVMDQGWGLTEVGIEKPILLIMAPMTLAVVLAACWRP
jgi:hypothetical protein